VKPGAVALAALPFLGAALLAVSQSSASPSLAAPGAAFPSSASSSVGARSPNSEVIEAAAQKGSRPVGCLGDAAFWRAPLATRSSDCAKLARGYSLLSSEPERARKLASEIRPGSAAANAAALLEARAAVALRDFQAARAAFARAGIETPESLFDVALLLAYARTAVHTKNRSQAAAAYRLLMPRVGALPASGSVRLAAVVEAAFAVMNESKGGAAEAMVFLAPQLEQNEYRGSETIARLALALAGDRRAEGGGSAPPASAVAEGQLALAWLSDSDRSALEAFSLEASEPGAARGLWSKFLELSGPDHPFRAHAEARRARLGGPG
jgi:hypothetical protein